MTRPVQIYLLDFAQNPNEPRRQIGGVSNCIVPSEDEIPKPWLSVASLYRCESCDVASTIMAESKPLHLPLLLPYSRLKLLSRKQPRKRLRQRRPGRLSPSLRMENKGKNGKGTRKVAVAPVEGKVKTRRSISIS